MRPTSDRAREALFASLAEAVVGARVLDLCAGTGAVGLEALSRGALSCAFVESDGMACDAIRRNVGACGLEDRARVVRSDALRYLDALPEDTAFELVFADPPYSSTVLAGIADRLDARPGLVAVGGLVVFEAGEEDMPGLSLKNHLCRWRRRYGAAWFALHERVGDRDTAEEGNGRG
jgi:16S rRNA (guanine966-N2)-methyltransferase